MCVVGEFLLVLWMTDSANSAFGWLGKLLGRGLIGDSRELQSGLLTVSRTRPGSSSTVCGAWFRR